MRLLVFKLPAEGRRGERKRGKKGREGRGEEGVPDLKVEKVATLVSDTSDA